MHDGQNSNRAAAQYSCQRCPTHGQQLIRSRGRVLDCLSAHAANQPWLLKTRRHQAVWPLDARRARQRCRMGASREPIYEPLLNLAVKRHCDFAFFCDTARVRQQRLQFFSARLLFFIADNQSLRHSAAGTTTSSPFQHSVLPAKQIGGSQSDESHSSL